MGKNGISKMGSNKEIPHSASTSYLRTVRLKNTKCDNNPTSVGKYDDKDDTDDFKSDDNASTKCDNNPSFDGKYDDNTLLALSKRKRKYVQREEHEKKRKKNVKKHDAIRQNVPSPPSEHLRSKNASRRWHILKKRAIIKEVNIQQTHYAAFDRNVPLEKPWLM
ncbi:hypothetical protein ACFE04_020710 [Oxalis oulophora]